MLTWAAVPSCRILRIPVSSLHMRFSPHFYDWVFIKRPYLTEEMCIQVVDDPLHVEVQENGRFAHWRMMDLFGDGVLRPLCVITLDSSEYLITAYPDRSFLRRHRDMLP